MERLAEGMEPQSDRRKSSGVLQAGGCSSQRYTVCFRCSQFTEMRTGPGDGHADCSDLIITCYMCVSRCRLCTLISMHN